MFQYTPLFEVCNPVGLSHPGRLHPRVPVRVLMAVLPSAPLRIRLVQIPGLGFLDLLRVHSADLGHAVLLLHTGALAVLRRQHLRVGAVCLAHRQGHMCPHDNTLDTVRVSGGGGEAARHQTHARPPGPVPAVCRPLHRLSRGDPRFRLQVVRGVQDAAAQAAGRRQGEPVLHAADATGAAHRDGPPHRTD